MAKYTTEWDFSLIYKSEKEILSDIDSFKKMTTEIKKFEGRLNNEEDIILYLKESEAMMKVIYRLDFYVSLKVDKNNKDSKSLKLYGDIMNLITEYSVATAFVQPEIAKNLDAFLESLRNKYSDYARFFESVIREKKHTISKDKEELIAGIGNFSDFSEIYDRLTNNEIKFDDIVTDQGEHYTLNDSTYGLYIKNEDEDIRKQASQNLLRGYSKYNLTISQIYLDYLKKKDFISKTYNFKSTFDRACFGEEVDSEVYYNLIKTVRDNIPLYQRYLKTKAKTLKKEEFLISDIHAPIGDASGFKYNYDEAVNVVLDTVSILGEKYVSVAKKMFESGMVDVYPAEGKRSGAYSSSASTGYQFMLLNHNNTYSDVSTIAHELGHSMHSYFSENTQPYFDQRYVIFVAEIASTVNEILLAKKMLSVAKTKEERIYLADSLLSEFCSTVFRQTMFSEFEFYSNDSINKSISISYDEFNNYYQNLLNDYFGDAVKLHEYTKYEWSRIPHFYRAFYVYKYATGFISAVSIAKQIEEKGREYVDNCYMKFLSAGSSMDPVSILKLANVDITTDKPYKEAFKFFSELIDLIK